MSVLITGCSGFLGGLLSSHFAAAGHDCYGVGTVSPGNAPSHALRAYRQCRLPSEEVAGWVAELRPRLLIHAAGRSSVPLSVEDPAADFGAGPPVVFQLLEAIRRHSPATAFVLLSSAAVYGNPERLPIPESCRPAPISPYGFHKLQSEWIVREFAQVYGLRAASARIFSAYGPGLRRQLLWDFCRKALADPLVELQGSGAESRDFIYGTDICEAVSCISEQAPLAGEALNICSGEQTSIAALADLLASHFPTPVQVRFRGDRPDGVPLCWQGDATALQSLGFQPRVPLAEGVRRTVEWFRSLP